MGRLVSNSLYHRDEIKTLEQTRTLCRGMPKIPLLGSPTEAPPWTAQAKLYPLMFVLNKSKTYFVSFTQTV